MSTANSNDSNQVITSQRAARLYRLLNLTANGPCARKAIMKKLKVDLRGFYRDLEYLRSIGVEVPSDGDKYHLVGSIDDALSLLPFPDPGLSLQEALQLSQGKSQAHRKLRSRIDAFIGSNGK